jgi:hypothetical protein
MRNLRIDTATSTAFMEVNTLPKATDFVAFLEDH